MEFNYTTIAAGCLTLIGSFVTGYLVFKNRTREQLDDSLFQHLHDLSARLDATNAELAETKKNLAQQAKEILELHSQLVTLEQKQGLIRNALIKVEQAVPLILSYLKAEPPNISNAKELLETTATALSSLNAFIDDISDDKNE